MANLKKTKIFVKYLGEEKTRVKIGKHGEKVKMKKGKQFETDIITAYKLAKSSKNFEIIGSNYEDLQKEIEKKEKAEKALTKKNIKDAEEARKALEKDEDAEKTKKEATKAFCEMIDTKTAEEIQEMEDEIQTILDSDDIDKEFCLGYVNEAYNEKRDAVIAEENAAAEADGKNDEDEVKKEDSPKVEKTTEKKKK